MQTVRELAVSNPAAVTVLEKYGIDFCCGGQRPLDTACRERGIPAELVLAEVAKHASEAAEHDWTSAPLAELIDYVVARHHGYLGTELPALEARMAKVVAKHGPKHPELFPQLQNVFAGLKAELESHLQKEERVLFPAIKEMEAARAEHRPANLPPFGSVGNPIRMMEHEHDGAGYALAAMRTLTRGYAAPEDACTTFRALYEGLAALEADLHAHIHLENNILFPRAMALESHA